MQAINTVMASSRYFENFPLIAYDGDVILDVFRRVTLDSVAVNETSSFYYDNVRDGEMPEDTAFRLYGDQYLYWILCLINNVHDIENDWFLPDEILKAKTLKELGSLTALHHREDDKGNITQNGVVTVNNLQHMAKINNTKRKIKVLRRSFVPSFISQFSDLINQ